MSNNESHSAAARAILNNKEEPEMYSSEELQNGDVPEERDFENKIEEIYIKVECHDEETGSPAAQNHNEIKGKKSIESSHIHNYIM